MKALPSPWLLRPIAAICSAAMLAAAFPPFGKPGFAWAALVPLLMVAMFSAPSVAFRWGWFSGFVFWLVNMSWLLNLWVTAGIGFLAVVGWVLLAAYCALYAGVFLFTASWLARKLRIYTDRTDGSQASMASRVNETLRQSAWMFILPVVWVGCEYGRAVIMGGFPWNMLGVSQYESLPLIQIAELGGVYAISFVLVLMNGVLTLTAMRFVSVYLWRRRDVMPFRVDLTAGALVVLSSWAFGVTRLNELSRNAPSGKEVRVVVVQPNVAQTNKFDAAFTTNILNVLRDLTQGGYAMAPDIVVWPETSLPMPYGQFPEVSGPVNELASNGVPILIGTLDVVPGVGTARIYNSAMLVNTNGRVTGDYRKRHLVPFGEYIPVFSGLAVKMGIVPPWFNCSEGNDVSMMHLETPGVSFAVLICFEDAFAWLARDAVRAGASFLINQTNDAWFDGTSGAEQHVSQCVFRAIENRIAIVRSANSGVSCMVDERGRTVALEADGRRTMFAGKYVFPIFARGSADVPTVYTRYGDMVLAGPCAIVAGILFLAACFATLRSKRLADEQTLRHFQTNAKCEEQG